MKLAILERRAKRRAQAVTSYDELVLAIARGNDVESADGILDQSGISDGQFATDVAAAKERLSLVQQVEEAGQQKTRAMELQQQLEEKIAERNRALEPFQEAIDLLQEQLARATSAGDHSTPTRRLLQSADPRIEAKLKTLRPQLQSTESRRDYQHNEIERIKASLPGLEQRVAAAASRLRAGIRDDDRRREYEQVETGFREQYRNSKTAISNAKKLANEADEEATKLTTEIRRLEALKLQPWPTLDQIEGDDA